MFDRQRFEEMPKYISFNYWFERSSLGKWNVIDKSTETVVGVLQEDVKDGEILSETTTTHLHPGVDAGVDIRVEFTRFRQRPEYAVGHCATSNFIQSNNTFSEDYGNDAMYLLKHQYEMLIVGVAFIKAKKSGRCPDPDTVFHRIERCLLWLRNTDFYVGPGSSVFHDSFPGGLLSHTFKVYNNAILLAESPQFRDCDVECIALTTLCHDWCKIGLYESYLKNVKDDVTGQWNKVEAYRKNQKGISLGHGVSSMYLVSRFFSLSTPEALAIRWHMGPWKCHDSEHDELQMSNEKYPLVHLVQFADQLSITEYANASN